MNDQLLSLLSQYGEISKDVSFKQLTTFRIGGTAKQLIYPKDSIALAAIVSILKENEIDYKVFGNGSNILCSDKEYNGLIIKLTRTFNNHYFTNNGMIANSGCSIIALSFLAMQNGLSGLEFASGIPGTIAGCVYMNAGAYKSSMSDIVEEVEVLIDGKLVWLSNQQCQFGYRKSIFQDHQDWIITNVKIKLTPDDKEKINQLMKDRQQRRMQSQPLEYPSAGSTFRNLDNQFSWQLIDSIGYRGKKIGGAQVSEKHSNFIINVDNASAMDVIQLTDQIKKEIKEKYNLDMIMEVERFNW